MECNWPILMAGGQDGGGGLYANLLLMGLLFLFAYLLLLRPQRKKQKEHEQLLKELKKGDKVVTSGGMFGTVFAIDDERNRVVLRIGEDTKLEFLKSSIAAKVDK